MSDSAPDNHEPTARILVVEDSLGVARSLSLARGLYREGIFRSETSPSAEEALERLHATHFDLIISDLRLPGMDGLALLERASQTSPETRSILITAFGSPEVAQRPPSLPTPTWPSQPGGGRKGRSTWGLSMGTSTA